MIVPNTYSGGQAIKAKRVITRLKKNSLAKKELCVNLLERGVPPRRKFIFSRTKSSLLAEFLIYSNLRNEYASYAMNSSRRSSVRILKNARFFPIVFNFLQGIASKFGR